MNKLLRITTFAVAIVLLAAIFNVVVFADEQNVAYTKNSDKFIFDASTDKTLSEMFTDFDKLTPGASITQKITVKNEKSNRIKAEIDLRVVGNENDEALDILNSLSVSVSADGVAPMFEAIPDKASWLTDWVELGKLYSGGTATINVKLEVPSDISEDFVNKVGNLRWEFLVVELPIDGVKWTCPNCGKSNFHIVDRKNSSECVCNECKKKETMLCDVCKVNMKLVTVEGDNGKTYGYYQCEKDNTHRTDPSIWISVNKTGIYLWVVLAIICLSAIVFIVILIIKTRFDIKPKKKTEETTVNQE